MWLGIDRDGERGALTSQAGDAGHPIKPVENS